MPRPYPSTRRSPLIPALDIVAWGVVLVYAEALRAHRSAYWPGPSWEGWLGSGMAFALYTVAIALVVALICAIGSVLPRLRNQLLDNAAPLAALAVWAVVAAIAGEPATTVGLGVFFLAAAYATAGYLLRHLRPEGRVWLPFALIVAFTGGFLSLSIADSLFFLTPARADAASAFTLVHVAFVLAVLAAAIPMAARAVPGVVAVLGLVMAFAPGMIWIVQPSRIPAPDGAPPNVVFITFDALRADWISTYGGPVPMPAFERLAGEGIQFEHAYTLGPWTIPSMFACIASQYPEALPPGADRDQLAAEMAGYRFEPGEATLAERATEAGALTAAFGGNSLLDHPDGILRGFVMHQVWPHRPPVRYGLLEHAPLLQAAWHALGLPGVEERPVDTTRILQARAETFIRRNAGGRYFLWVHFMDPHGAFAPPPRFRPVDSPWAVYCNADPRWETPLTDADGRLEVTDAEREAIRALYQGEMRYIDEALGAVLDTLDESGVRNRSFVIVSSDHGEEFWDHGEFGHGHSLYDEMVRAPLMVTGPGIPAAHSIAQPISHLDLIPTMASLLGVEADPGWLGINRAPHWLTGEPGPAEPVFAQGTNLYSRHGPQQMMIADGIKYIRSLDGDWETAYSLLDGLEIALPPAEVQRRAGVMGALPVRGTGPEGSELDETVQEQLRAFGYVHE